VGNRVQTLASGQSNRGMHTYKEQAHSKKEDMFKKEPRMRNFTITNFTQNFRLYIENDPSHTHTYQHSQKSIQTHYRQKKN